MAEVYLHGDYAEYCLTLDNLKEKCLRRSSPTRGILIGILVARSHFPSRSLAQTRKAKSGNRTHRP